MSNNTLYYGEIVARIAVKLQPIINHSNDNNPLHQSDTSIEDIICDISADAGRVFDTFEDLSGEHFIDWQKALNYYANSLRSVLLDERIPSMADLISMAAKSMDISRSEKVAKAKDLL